MKTYLEFKNDKSQKFWEVYFENNNVITLYGKIGSKGKKNIKTHPSEAIAKLEMEKQIINKIKKGYELPKATEFESGTLNETAKEAITRYNRFLSFFYTDDEDEIENNKAIFHLPKITEDELSKTEERLNFKFPPSYRNFVLENGMLSFNTEFGEDSVMLEINKVSSLYIELNNEWQEDVNVFEKNGKGEKLKNETENLICFSFGDSSLQMVWYYYFDKRSLNIQTGEMSIGEFSQDNWFFEPLLVSESNGFDEHIVKLVNEKIEYHINE